MSHHNEEYRAYLCEMHLSAEAEEQIITYLEAWCHSFIAPAFGEHPVQHTTAGALELQQLIATTQGEAMLR